MQFVDEYWMASRHDARAGRPEWWNSWLYKAAVIECRAGCTVIGLRASASIWVVLTDRQTDAWCATSACCNTIRDVTLYSCLNTAVCVNTLYTYISLWLSLMSLTDVPCIPLRYSGLVRNIAHWYSRRPSECCFQSGVSVSNFVCLSAVLREHGCR